MSSARDFTRSSSHASPLTLFQPTSKRRRTMASQHRVIARSASSLSSQPSSLASLPVKRECEPLAVEPVNVLRSAPHQQLTSPLPLQRLPLEDPSQSLPAHSASPIQPKTEQHCEPGRMAQPPQEVAKIEPVLNSAASDRPSLETHQQPTPPSNLNPATPNAAPVETREDPRDEQSNKTPVTPFQPHSKEATQQKVVTNQKSVKHDVFNSPLPSRGALFETAAVRDKAFKPPITDAKVTDAVSKSTPSPHPEHPSPNASEAQKITGFTLMPQVTRSSQEQDAHGHTKPQSRSTSLNIAKPQHLSPLSRKRVHADTPPTPIKRPRPFLQKTSSPSEPAQSPSLLKETSHIAQAFVMQPTARIQLESDPTSRPKMHTRSPLTSKALQKPSSSTPSAGENYHCSLSKPADSVALTRSTDRESSPIVPRQRERLQKPPSSPAIRRVPSANSPLCSNGRLNAMPPGSPFGPLRAREDSRSPIFRIPQGRFSSPRTPHRRSPTARIRQMDRSPSPPSPRRTSSRTDLPVTRGAGRSASPVRSPDWHHSSVLLRPSRRSRSPLLRQPRSHSPTRYKDWPQSPSPRRYGSCIPTHFRQYSRSPSSRGHALRSPLSQFRRSHSPTCDVRGSPPPYCNRSSLSPPYRSRRSRSPPYRSRRSLSPPYRSRRSLSPPYRSRRSVSPPYRSRHSLSPPYRSRHSLSPPYRSRHSVSPPYRSRHSLSPPRRSRRSLSPPCRSRRSPSPPHRSPRSFSPPYRNRHSNSSPHRSHHSPSPPHHRRSQSPFSYRLRSRSPPPQAVRPPPTPSTCARQLGAHSPLAQPRRAANGREDPYAIARNTQSHVFMETVLVEALALQENSASIKKKTNNKRPPEEQRPARSMRAIVKPDTVTKSNSRTRAPGLSRRRYEPKPLPAWMNEKVNCIDSKEREAPSRGKSAKSSKVPSLLSNQLRASKNGLKSDSKESEAPKVQSVPGRTSQLDPVPLKTTLSKSGRTQIVGQCASGLHASLTSRPLATKGPSRPPLVPFDPFGPAPRAPDKNVSQKEGVLKASETNIPDPNDDRDEADKDKAADSSNELELADYLIDYGLHIIERDPLHLEVTWLGCKFCPLFGCSQRNKNYLMVFQRPFSAQNFVRHLSSSHQRHWDIYKHAPIEAKKKFFEGRTLPPDFLFSMRIAELKHGNTKLGEKTPEQQRIQNLPYAVKTERVAEYRRIADKEADENENRLAALEKSIPMRFKSKQVLDRIDLSERLEKAGFSNSLEVQKPRIDINSDLTEETEIRCSIERKGSAKYSEKDLRTMVHTRAALFAARSYGELVDEERHRSFDVSFFDSDGGVFDTKEVILDEDDPELNAGRQYIRFSPQELEMNRAHRLPRMRRILHSFIVLHKWLTMFQYDDSNSDDDKCTAVSDDALVHQETKSRSVTEIALLLENHSHTAISDHGTKSFVTQGENIHFSGLVLFYLLRGVCVSVIVSFLKKVTEATGTRHDSENIENLVHSIGHSIVATSLRLARSLSENHVTAWGVALRTRVCPEIDGIEILLCMHLKEWRLLTTHVVSVRRARGAADVASKVLDCICEDWRLRVMGVASEVPATNHKAKKMERIFFEELQDIDGIDTNVLLVDTDLPIEARPVYAGVLVDMSKDEFGILLEHHRVRLRHWFGDEMELEKLKAQRDVLCSLYQERPYESSECHNTWPRKRKIRSLMNFAQVLSALWKKIYELPSGCTEVGKVVDCHEHECIGLFCPSIERIYWARTLVNLVQEKKGCFSGLSLPPLGSQWASNWSNWEVYPSHQR